MMCFSRQLSASHQQQTHHRHVHRSRFWIVWNKVHREDLVFVQQKRMPDGDIYYHLFLRTCEHILQGPHVHLCRKQIWWKRFFQVRKSVTRRGLLVMCLVVKVSCVQAITVLLPKEKTCYSPVICPYLFLGCGGICCFLFCEMVSTLRSFLWKENLPCGISQEHLQKFTWFQKSGVQKCLVWFGCPTK